MDSTDLTPAPLSRAPLSPAPLTLAAAHHSGLELVDRHVRRFVDFITGLDDVARATPIPGGEWTVAQTVVHLQSVLLRYTTDMRRAESAAAVATQNADDLLRLGGDVDAALASMLADLERLPAAVHVFEPDQLLPFHAGQPITLAGAWGNLLGELLAHGDDVAQAAGTEFNVPGEDLEIMWRFTTPVLAGWLRPDAAEAQERWRLSFPFGAIDLELDRGRLAVGPADVTVAVPSERSLEVGDVAEFTLSFPYGRRPPAEARMANLAGRFLAL